MTRTISTALALAGLLLLVSWPNISASQSFGIGIGQSYLKQTLNNERLPPLVTQDVSAQLSAPGAFAEYRVQFHQDELWRQQLKMGVNVHPTSTKTVRPFYSLDLFGKTRYSGAGILFSRQRDGGKQFDLSALYRESGYGFSGKLTMQNPYLGGGVGLDYDKYGNSVIWGPSVELGVRW